MNPVITARSETTEIAVEGCLSLDVQVAVQRHEWIWVNGRTADMKWSSFGCRSLLARVIQHEIDHLDGILITDRGEPQEINEKISPFQEGLSGE